LHFHIVWFGIEYIAVSTTYSTALVFNVSIISLALTRIVAEEEAVEWIGCFN